MPADPVKASRIQALDGARGLALFGILILNIGGFALPRAAYMNPAYAGMPSFSDGAVWTILNVAAQGSFLAAFALLFGAGLELLHRRGSFWNLSRLCWLAMLGFVHGVWLWEGDILLTYALVGIGGVLVMRASSTVRGLLSTGVVLFAIGLLLLFWMGTLMAGVTSADWTPTATDIAREAAWKLAGGEAARGQRLSMTLSVLLSVFLQYGWQLLGLMLIGAALMRNGWLKGEWSTAVYRRQGWFWLLASLAIKAFAVALQWRFEWDLAVSGYYLQVVKEVGSVLQGLAYLALWFGYGQSAGMARVRSLLSQVGRMTLSNYLLQTLVCTTLFYHFGGYRHFDRLTLLAFVPAVWGVNLLFSLIWLRYFRQGPLEWLWRKLTDAVVQRRGA
ncbi:hypothetical protein SOASR030_04900 [Leminorella grimontii]|uniref:DUF418 domain-containing protein n=1 Tax=Leminorella grimontii TaxID=82981 RepID=A0AAV5MYM0_9GAMM|nr:DUF418 domain-containing protein YeiB [Leminorella grimontii]KFC96433.1 hypothetical protein GLGR_1609 [Leminorella grimontii ATCC 33999 = DSM 5078]GKX54378.1 hypothetical protein SOASR030_04900 [Leminorella grimontii]